MKKRFLVMAIAGLALAGCVNEDVSDVKQKEQGKLIGFDQLMLYNTASRAGFYGEIGQGVEVTGSQRYSYPKTEQFMIFACEHEGEYENWETTEDFWNVNTENPNPTLAVYHQDYGGWFPYNNKFIYKEWPINKKVTFVAYSPADLKPYTLANEVETGEDSPNVSYSDEGLSITDFKVASDPKRQIDLLYSNLSKNNTVENLQLGIENKYNGIPLVFNHALSSIHFGLLNSTDQEADIEVYLTGLTVKTVCERGSYNNKVWTTGTGTEDYTCYTVKSKGVKFPRAVMHVSEAIDDQDLATEEFNSLLLIPQSTNNITISVSYKVVDANDVEESFDNREFSIHELSGTEGTSSVTVENWEPGKRYTYVLRYGAAATGKDYIYFAPETNLWTNVENLIVDLK